MLDLYFKESFSNPIEHDTGNHEKLPKELNDDNILYDDYVVKYDEALICLSGEVVGPKLPSNANQNMFTIDKWYSKNFDLSNIES